MKNALDLRRSLTVRFKKIRGQIQGIERMLDEKACKDIFIQLSAAKSALDKASLLVLENHMQSCLIGASDEESLKTQKENLVRFIRDYKYGCSHSVPYVQQNLVVLLQESADRVGIVIETLESFEKNRCSDILKNTSEIRELLGRVGLMLLEQEIEESTMDDSSAPNFNSLEDILNMAKKFII